MNYLLHLMAQSDILEGVRFTTENLPTALKYMGIGMGSIFIALLIIYAFSLLLQKVFPADDEE